MNKYLKTLLLSIALLAITSVSAHNAMSQTIELLSEDSPHVFQADLVVPVGGNLIVHAGSILIFGEGANLIVNGTCTIQGSQSAPVVLTSTSDALYVTNPTTTSYWGGIVLNNSSHASFAYTKIKYAGNSGDTQNSICYISNSHASFASCQFFGDNYKGVIVQNNAVVDFGGGATSMGKNKFMGFQAPRYAIANYTPNTINATNNCWGGVASVDAIIYDQSNNPNIGTITYMPQAATCETMIPAIVNLFSPVDNAVGTPRNQYLKWNAVEDATEYRIQVAEDIAFTSPILNAVTSDIKQSFYSDKYAQKYYWRVQASNSLGASTWNTPWAFTIYDTACPAVPTDFFPDNNAIAKARKALLSWTYDPSVTEYQLEVYEGDGAGSWIDTFFLGTIVNAEIQPRIFRNDLNMRPPDTYFLGAYKEVADLKLNAEYGWRVRGKNENGYGYFSEMKTFSTSQVLENTYSSITRQILSAADFDNDGEIEMVCRKNGLIYLSKYSKFGDIAMRPPDTYFVAIPWIDTYSIDESSSIDTFFVDTPLLSNSDANVSCFGDFNNDGLTDIAILGTSGNKMLIKTTTGYDIENISNISSNVIKAMPADMDRNGREDLVCQFDDGFGVYSYYCCGRSIDTHFVTMNVHDMLIADMNGDNQYDILLSGTENGSEKTKILINNHLDFELSQTINGKVLAVNLDADLTATYIISENGVLRRKCGNNAITIATGNYDKVIEADFNSDGALELLAYSSATQKVTVFAFANNTYTTIAEIDGINADNFILLDVDGDNALDILANSDTGYTYLKNYREDTGNIVNTPVSMRYSYSGDNIILEWDAVGAIAAGDKFQIELVGENNEPIYSAFADTRLSVENEYSNVTNRDYFILTEPDSGIYYWRIRAIDGSGKVSEFSNWDIVYTLGINPLPPACWLYEKKTGSNATVLISGNPPAKYNEQELCAGDAVGVFYQSGTDLVCGGYAIVRGDGNIAMTAWGDNKITESVKDGFLNNEEFKFKLWDAVNSKEIPAYGVFADETVMYGKDQRYYVSKFEKADTVNIEIPTNKVVMVSSYIDPFQEYLGEIIQNSNTIFANENYDLFKSDSENNKLMYWDVAQGYSVYSRTQETLTIYGKKISPENLDIRVNANDWTIIPYPIDFPTDVELVFAGLKDDIIAMKDDEGNMYIPYRKVNTLKMLSPNKAYKILTKNDVAIEYSSVVPEYSTEKADAEFTHYSKTGYFTGSNMCIILDCPDLESGDEVIVKNSLGRVYGSAISQKGQCAVTIWGDNRFTNEIEAAVDAEQLYIEVYQKAFNREFIPTIEKTTTLSGQINDGLIYKEDGLVVVKAVLSAVSGVNDKFYGNDVVKVYPNPADTYLMIELNTTELVNSIEIYNLTGKKVATIENVNATKTINYNINGLETGMYILRTIIGSRSYENKVMINKK